MPDLRSLGQIELKVRKVLDTRLSKSSDRPLLLGLSGGGDSVALALLTADWARDHNRTLFLVTIDHGLNPDSAGWGESCAALAASLKVGFRQLRWEGAKPLAGIPAAARAARHRLLAEAGRDLGASVILLGHTADDRAEGQLMREAGSMTPDPREWAPSPVWPEGRGMFLLRPMLNLRRNQLRQWLTSKSAVWVEDPANHDLKFARARARSKLDPLAFVATCDEGDDELANLAAMVSFLPVLNLPRACLRQASFNSVRALIGIACLCVSGGSRPPRTQHLNRLVDQLLGEGDVVATLSGARIEADSTQIRWMRNPGELFRRRTPPTLLQPGVPAVWDGRYEFTSTSLREIVPLQGRFAELSASARRQIRDHPAAARGALPLVRGETTGCPILQDVLDLTIHDLAGDRFCAATGLVSSEPC